jgi:hypothetical protein
MGRLLYDESRIARGVEIRSYRRALLATVSVVFGLLCTWILYFLLTYGRRDLFFLAVVPVIAILGYFFVAAMAYGAYENKCMKVYERGILIERTSPLKDWFWPFTEIEKIEFIPARREDVKGVVWLTFKKGSEAKGWRSRRIGLESVDKVADYHAFARALEGRVPLGNL